MLDGYFSVERPRKSAKVIVGALAVVVVIGLVAVSYKSSPSIALQQFQLEEQEFQEYMQAYDKVYANELEYNSRFKIFRDNLAYIRVFNSLNKDWTLGVNHFTDLTGEEFKARFTGYKRVERVRNEEEFEPVEIPTSVDWTTKGAVTGVKNQGQCGSCWSFSATGAIEGAVFLSGKPLVSLSEQQLVDCSGSYGNYGCNGGLMDYAFQYVKANGLTTEANYPYTARDGTCNKTKAAQISAKISGYKDVTASNAVALETAIAQQPVSVAVEADQAAWQSYSSGTVSSNCGTSLDHGVLAVGYNLGANPPYYKVKNSWGTSWGLAGYIQIAIVNGSGVCGIQLEPSYPIA
jgi:C1A family cysteine protease